MNTDPITDFDTLQSRRSFLLNSGVGLGAAALGSLFPGSGLAAAAKPGSGMHHPAKAKRVIFLFMAGAPSQVDLFDYKPDLHKQFKKELPKSVSKKQRVTAMTRGKQQLVAPSMFKFDQHGKSGLWMSELLPHLSTQADDLCMVHSFNTNAINHDPGKNFVLHGLRDPWQGEHGRLVELRARQSKQRPAGLRRDAIGLLER